MSFRTLAIRVVAQPRSWWRAASRRGLLHANHLECLTADLIRAGHAPDEASPRARIAIGSSLVTKDELRADMRFASRMLRKNLGFTAIASLSLALAIGANTTIFSVAKQLLYDRLAVPHAEDLRLLSWTGTEEHVAVHSIWGDYDAIPGGRRASTAFSYQAYQQLRAQNREFDDLFAFKRTSVNATIRGTALRIRGELVSGNYFSALDVKPLLGRTITPADDAQPGQGAIAVIGYGLWEREFARSASGLGQVIRVNDVPLTIVGVTPKEFTSAKDVQTPADIFVPLSMQPLLAPMGRHASLLNDPKIWWVNVMGRARRDVPAARIQTALDTRLGTIVRSTMPVRAYEDLPRIVVRDGSRGLLEQQATFAKPMAVLLTLDGLVLLLACANIATLMLARGSQRQREINVRLALGAGRARIIRQMLVESLMLAALGGAGGLLAAQFGRNAIPAMIENSWERTDIQIHFDWRVFGFAALITLFTGILFGLAPALAAARADVNHGLKEAAQSTTRRRREPADLC